MAKIRLILTIVTILVVGFLGYFVSLYARGYRLNLKTLRIEPNGILVIKTDPTGAQILVNGELKGASDSNLSLSPGIYDVTVSKEGYLSWYKRLTIEKEVVTEANLSLFKTTPSLSPITFSGSANPIISEDSTKIAFTVLPSPDNTNNQDKLGLWIMEMINFPLGFSRDPRRITDGDLTNASWQFSPSGREILLTTASGVFLLDTGTFTSQKERVNIVSKKDSTLVSWQQEKNNKILAQTRNLPTEIVDLLQRKVGEVIFSPDETKILYTASTQTSLSPALVKPLPGSSTQKEERNLEPGKTYIYDIKEDRNFLVYDQLVTLDGQDTTLQQATIRWFPTSRNLVLAESGKITIMDYDGTNRQEVYTGSYEAPFAFPFANSEKLIILINLGSSSIPNLYSLSLK